MAEKITIQEFITKWGFEVDDAKLKQIDAAFIESRKTLEKLESKAQEVGGALTKYLTLPILAASGFSVKLAADALDTQERFEQVFNQIGSSALTLAKQFGSTYGLSNAAAQTLLVTNGELLKNLGFNQKESLKYAQTIGALSADIAEFKQVEGGAAAVSDILKASLTGQTRGLKQLGITIDDDIIKKQVQEDAAKGLIFSTLKQAEAHAILQLIQKKSKDSSGAFAKSQDDLGVVLSKVKARLANIAVIFGKILLPPIVKVLKVFDSMLQKFEGLSQGAQNTILILLGIAAALGPMLLLTAQAIKLWTAWRTAVVLFGNASLIAAAKVLAIPLLIIAAFAVLYLIFDDIKGFLEGKDSVTGVLLEQFGKAFDWLNEKFTSFGETAKAIFIGLLLPIRLVIAAVRTIGQLTLAARSGDFSSAFSAIKQIGSDFVSPYSSLASGQTANIGIGESLGLGPSTVSPSGSKGSSVSQSVNAPITVNVPPGTPPESVGGFVQQGVSDGMSSVLRETQRQTRSAVIN